jgi:hypothetical protein
MFMVNEERIVQRIFENVDYSIESVEDDYGIAMALYAHMIGLDE